MPKSLIIYSSIDGHTKAICKKIREYNDNEEFDICAISDMPSNLDEYKNIINYMGDVHKILDNAAYGHDDAKKQIERIIGQWITGDQTGYCFGFDSFFAFRLFAR